MTDPRVEAVADPLCRMLGHGPLDRAPLMVADAVRGRARELLAAADAAAWQPIETAPQDKKILILRAGRVSIGWFNDERYNRNPSPYWSGYDSTHNVRWARETPPTHWQPLPPPPSPAVPLDGEGERDAAEPKRLPGPDFGMLTHEHEGVVLECKAIAPGLSLHDLVVAFEDAKKQAAPGDELSANPSKWPVVRGVLAVRNALVGAIYGAVPLAEIAEETTQKTFRYALECICMHPCHCSPEREKDDEERPCASCIAHVALGKGDPGAGI